MSSRLAYGCMRIVGDGSDESRRRGKTAVRTAIEEGYTHFDHADIYGDGRCEELFSEVLREMPGTRDKLFITGKCGIRQAGRPGREDPARYDFSPEHLVASVDGSLGRLGVDHLDLLLLHRPDHLMDASAVAGVFDELLAAGKVRHFGVSNFRRSQISLLMGFCSMPLLVNQVEINIHNIDALTDGTLDQCQELTITPQAWCPMGGVAYPAWGNSFSVEDEARIAGEFARQAEKYGVEDWIIMLAWLLRHPAKIMPIIGSTTPSRIRAARSALAVRYSRDDWYRLLEARNGRPVP